jgi:hypothetical protein
MKSGSVEKKHKVGSDITIHLKDKTPALLIL